MLTVSRNAWHYELADKGGFYVWEEDPMTDLCSYFWAVVRGCLLVLLMMGAGVMAGFVWVLAPAIVIFAWLTDSLFYDQSYIAVAATTGWGMVAVFAIGYAIKTAVVGGVKVVGGLSGAEVIANRYADWKEKRCSRIVIVD